MIEPAMLRQAAVPAADEHMFELKRDVLTGLAPLIASHANLPRMAQAVLAQDARRLGIASS